MDFYKVPIGFGLALAQNETAMAKYGSLSREQKQQYLDMAHNARSEKEMYQIVARIAGLS